MAHKKHRDHAAIARKAAADIQDSYGAAKAGPPMPPPAPPQPMPQQGVIPQSGQPDEV